MTSKFTILTDSRLHIYFLKTSNSCILKNKDPVNWEENSELGVCDFIISIHDFLVQKNMYWEVALYMIFVLMGITIISGFDFSKNKKLFSLERAINTAEFSPFL